MQLQRQANGRNIVFSALGNFVYAGQLSPLRARHFDVGQYFISSHAGLAIGGVERLQGHLAVAACAGQHDVAAQGDQQRHGVANRRAIGHVATQGARVSHRQAGKAVGKTLQLRTVFDQRGKGLVQADCGAYSNVVRVAVYLAQFPYPRGVQHARKLAVLLGHPQADIGATGDQLRVRMRAAQGKQFRQGSGGEVGGVGGLCGRSACRVFRPYRFRQRLELLAQRRPVQRHGRQQLHLAGSIQYGAIAGAAA